MTIKSTKAALVNYYMSNEFLNLVPNIFHSAATGPLLASYCKLYTIIALKGGNKKD